MNSVHHKKTVAIFTSSEGHFSLSEAVRQVLEPEYTVKVYYQGLTFSTAYILLYRFFPQLFVVPYLLSRNARFARLAKAIFFKRNHSAIEKFIKTNKPDVLICTYFMFLNALEHYQKELDIPLINVVANPHTIHPIELSNTATINSVFDELALSTGQKIAPQATINPWGWFVRAEYQQAYSQNQVRSELNLPSKQLTLVLVGGSEGNYKIAQLVPYLLNAQQQLTIITICGSNQALKTQIDTLVTNHPDHNKTFINIGFTTELYKYFQAADLVIGKAGPNVIFETVATHTPFFAISHIAGQEDGNLDLIKQYNLGFVEENIDNATILLNQILSQPEMLDSFQPALKKLAAVNKSAQNHLRQLLQHSS